jgi:uncharacterized membrane protein (DUF485 family)
MNDPAESTSQDKSNGTDWSGIAASATFKDLIALKKAFVVPAFIFFLIYYISLAVLVGYAPKFAAMRVIGTVNVAYLFGLSQLRRELGITVNERLVGRDAKAQCS